MKLVRQSNFELLRIFAMLLIIAHHSVVHSGLLSANGPIWQNPHAFNSFFLLAFGAFGKTAINIFIFITGYFTCKQDASIQKYAKLFLQVLFYRVVINTIFLTFDYQYFNWLDYLKMAIPFSGIGTFFVDSFLAFYLFIPILNILIKAMTKKEHLYTCFISIFFLTVLGQLKFPGIKILLMNYVFWFMILYIIGAYVRLYPNPIFNNIKLLFLSTVTLFGLGICSVWLCFSYKWNDIFFFVADSNSMIAFSLGLSLFLLFKNINIGYSKVVNFIATGVFGVLLIHDNSKTMQQWLWKNTLHIQDYYMTDYMPLRMITIVILIFIICNVLDQIRRHLIEAFLVKKKVFHANKSF